MARTTEQSFDKLFPLSIVAILAVVQMFSTFAIIALEFGHVFLHMKSTNLFVGFWTSIPFTILWISMFSVVCCCRRQSCASHALFQNVLSLVFGLILIAINIGFIKEPNKCFFPQGICQKLTWIEFLSESIECLVDGVEDHCGNTRISLIIWQTVAGLCLSLCCLIYLIVYIVIVVRKRKSTPTTRFQIDNEFSTFNAKQQRTMTISHHHHSYAISPQMVTASPSIFLPIYSAPVSPNETHYVNYFPANPYATISTNLSNDRF